MLMIIIMIPLMFYFIIFTVSSIIAIFLIISLLNLLQIEVDEDLWAGVTGLTPGFHNLLCFKLKIVGWS